MFGRSQVSETDVTIALAEHFHQEMPISLITMLKENRHVNVDVKWSLSLEIQALVR